MGVRAIGLCLILGFVLGETSAQVRQSYSGKFGFYAPSDGLNNGLVLGVDGITEFVNFGFFINLSADLYLKQSFNFFKDPKPDITRHQIILVPLTVGFGYKLFDVREAESRGYIGIGAGYYLFFYNVDYRDAQGGIIPSISDRSATKNSGNFVASAFFRALVGKIFLEPRIYFASKKEDAVPGSSRNYAYVVNPSGFSVVFGFQY